MAQGSSETEPASNTTDPLGPTSSPHGKNVTLYFPLHLLVNLHLVPGAKYIPI